MKTIKIILSLTLFVSIVNIYGQKGKHGNYTQSGTTVVNEFTTLSIDASAGGTIINVADANLNTNSYAWFGGNLEAGDLLFIIQIQGADINGSPEPWSGTGWYGLPLDPTWGEVTDYNNCGNNEYVEVKSIAGPTTIELRCGLKNDYTSAGMVQVIRVPRFYDLTVNGTLTTQAWDGNTGGVLAVEVENDLTINGSGEILATGLGFRGGIPDTGPSELGVGHRSRPDADAGGLKGESIRGWGVEYDINGGRYCKGAPANSGGGGNAHNGGGGGGGNAGDLSNWNEGVGVPQGTYNAWSLEATDITGFISTGGGRGGYTFSGSNQNANSTGPGDGAWGGDNRQNRGGLGGRPLDYSTGDLFLGGAGGAADLNESSSNGGGGGNGGGLIYILNYGSTLGSGSIISNGDNGEDTWASSASFGDIAGNDGAGGAGAGGTIVLNSNGTISSGITIDANGGAGGNQILIDGGFGNMNEAEGPGGGGGGGYIAISNGTPTRSANGGNNGITNSNGVTEFPMNGATSGGTGLPNETIGNYYLTTTNDTICSGTTSTLTVTVNGTLPSGTTITWYDDEVNGNVIGTNTFTTGNLFSDTIFYVGTCPGNYLIPVSVIISPPIAINDASMLIGNENCGQSDGAISGITVSGGTSPLIYEWNGNLSATPDLSGATAGNYNFQVTDAKGCIATSGPYTIGSGSGVTLDITSISITNENCGLGDGSITGITTTGGTGTITYEWNGNSSPDEDLSNVTAGNYTLVATDALGCSASSGPHTISNLSGPSLNDAALITTDETCSLSNGELTGITVSGGTPGYAYSWNGNTTVSLDTIGLDAGNYTLTVTDVNGCTDQLGPYTITNDSGPSLDSTGLTVSDETCGNTNGSISGISATGGTIPYVFSWNGNTTLTADTSSIASGVYTLTVTDINGCSVTSNSITVNNIGLNVDTSSVTIVNDACSQGSGSITGITASGGTGTLTYSWNGTTSLGPDTTNLVANTYTLTIVDGVGCTFTTNPYTVLNNSGPTIDSTNIVVTEETCSGVNGGITGITSSGGLLPFTYQWNGNSTLSEDTAGITGGNYTLVVTDANGCFSTMGPIVVNSFDAPVIDTSSISIIDETCYAENGSISGISISNGVAPYNYTWNGVSANLDTANLSNGSYVLNVVDDNGCSVSIGPFILINSGAPTADFTLSSNSIAPGETIDLSNTSSSDAVSYSWTFGDGSSSTLTNPSVTYANEGTYSICLVAVSSSSCPDTTCKTVTVIEEIESVIGIPSAFSPNGDSHNDVLYVKGSGITDLTFMIYNRYGEKVFETSDINDGWNGTHKGQQENAGVFVYYIEYEFTNGDRGTLKGNVSLVK